MDIFYPCRKEPIPIRHLNLRQSLGVDDITFFDDVTFIENEGGQSVDLVRAERSFLTSRHGPVDVVPYRRCKRPVALDRLERAISGQRFLTTYQCRTTPWSRKSLQVRSVACGALLLKNLCAFLGGSA